jgi:hypothetical protein
MRRSAGTTSTLEHSKGQPWLLTLGGGGGVQDDTLIDFVDKTVTTLFCMK